MTDRLDVYSDHNIDEPPRPVDAFFQDDSMLPDAFPQIARVIEISGDDPYGIRQEARELNDGLIEEFGKAPREEVRARRNNFDKSYGDLICAVAKQLYLEGKTDEIELIALDVINSISPIPFPEVAAKQVHEVLRRARDTEAASNDLISELRTVIPYDNPLARYEIAKLVTGDMSVDELSPRKTLLRMMQNTTNEGHSRYDQELLADIEHGFFDRHIAADAIRYAREYPDVNGNYNTIREYVESLSAMFGDKLSSDEIRESVARHTASWPDGPAASALGRLRSELAAKLRYNSNLATADQGFTVQMQTKSFGQLQQELMKAQVRTSVSRAKRQAIVSVPRRARALGGGAMAAGLSSQARVLTKQVITEAALESAQPKQEQEYMPEPRPLICVNGSGEEFERDSPEFQEMIDDFLKKYDNQSELTHVLNKALEHLARVDRKNPTGLIPLHDMIEVRGQKVPRWEVKPGNIPGLSPKGDRGRTLRILFAFAPDSDAAFVHSFESRKSISTTRRNTAAKRRRRR